MINAEKKSPEKPPAQKSFLDSEFSFGGVNLSQKMIFARHLSVMLKSGLSISEALTVIEGQAKGGLKKVVRDILRSVESGNSFSDSLKKHPKVFSDLFVSTAKAGEASGTLEENLLNTAAQLKREKELKTKIKGAMFYPLIVFSAASILGLLMAFFVLPKITPLFEGMKMELPATTRLLIFVSHQIQENGLMIIGSLVFFVVSFTWIVRQKFVFPVTHYLILHTPIVKNISRNSNLANFCLTFGTLLKSGLNIDEALNITKDTVNNYYFKKALSVISVRISKGAKLSDNLENYQNYFSSMVVSMVRVGEKTGNLEESLLFLSDFYEEEVDASTKTLSAAIEPIMLLFIGVAVGVLALSIVTPIYQITGNLG